MGDAMINIEEAKKILEASGAKGAAKEAKKLERKLKEAIGTTDLHFRAALKQGKKEVLMRWGNEYLPKALHEAYINTIEAQGFRVQVCCNDDGDGYEITVRMPEET